MRRKAPQEKKQLSYARDRRNVYGENDKSSRKAIPFRKRAANKANRHADAQTLAGANGRPDEDLAAAIEDKVLGRSPKQWRKTSDEPLGSVLAHRGNKRTWRLTAIVSEGQPILIAGMDPWSVPWKRLAGCIRVPHPSNRGQQLRVALWEIWHDNQPLRFAADEIAQGRWCFYEEA